MQGSLTTLWAMGIGALIFGVFRVAITGLRAYLLDHTANRIDTALINCLSRAETANPSFGSLLPLPASGDETKS